MDAIPFLRAGHDRVWVMLPDLGTVGHRFERLGI
jgi:hypothetical protein